MAKGDLRPHRSPRGGHFEISGYPTATVTAFNEHEPLLFVSGQVTLSGNDPAAIVGIAAEPNTDVDGAFLADNDTVGVYQVGGEELWISVNFATDGSSTATVPTQANAIGQPAGLTVDGSGRWFVDTGAGNLLVLIEDVLDAVNLPITDPALNTGPGRSVVFRFL